MAFFFLKRMGELLASGSEEEQKQMNLYLLRLFFLTPYDGARIFTDRWMPGSRR